MVVCRPLGHHQLTMLPDRMWEAAQERAEHDVLADRSSGDAGVFGRDSFEGEDLFLQGLILSKGRGIG